MPKPRSARAKAQAEAECEFKAEEVLYFHGGDKPNMVVTFVEMQKPKEGRPAVYKLKKTDGMPIFSMRSDLSRERRATDGRK